MTEKVLVVLQNAWSPLYAGQRWPRSSWLRALANSRSGKRLDLLVGELDPGSFDVRYENTTAEVAETSGGRRPADRRHVQDALGQRPDVVVACGKQAEEVLTALWRGPLLVIPHPASRLLTDDLYRVGAELLKMGHTARLALRQAREGVHVERLQPDLFSEEPSPIGGAA